MKKIEKELEKYYQDNLQRFGPGAKGVGWRDENAQQKRFEQLIKLVNASNEFSVNDLGCGVGNFLDFLISNNYKVTIYNGYDLLDSMLSIARQQYASFPNAHFFRLKGASEMKHADYTIASGIFNLKYAMPEHNWIGYILETMYFMNLYSSRGFAFNMLTKYSDKEYIQEHLYYADPLFFFDYCKRNFSKNVALLHDYNEYDFTLLVRK